MLANSADRIEISVLGGGGGISMCTLKYIDKYSEIVKMPTYRLQNVQNDRENL